MVASVVGAPVNGIGLVGIYPNAVIRSYDASLGDGTRLPASDIAAGILTAARAGRSVINLSLGSNQPDPGIDAAIAEAVRLGSLVVAASGNSGDQGNPPAYPADLPHVLTVAATDQTDQPASFSSQSPYVDLAAPGVDIPVAEILPDNWAPRIGHELLVTDRRRRRRLALDGASRPRCEPGGRDPATVGARRLHTRIRHRNGLRHPRHDGCSRSTHTAARQRRAERRRRKRCASDHARPAPRDERADASRRMRIRATSCASGFRPRSDSP